MRDRLADREEALLEVELAAEQHRHDCGGRGRPAGLSDGIDQFGQACAVVVAQRFDAGAYAAERQAVRRQHQRVVGQGLEGRERGEETCERVGIRLGRPHGDVGADLGQEHVAGNQYPSIGAMERGMFRRVSVARDHTEFRAAELQRGAREQAPIGRGQRGHAAPVGVAPCLEGGDVVVVDAVRAEQRARVRKCVSGMPGLHGVGGQELRGGHPHRPVEACREPRGVADVIRVVVRHHDAGGSPAAQRRREMARPQIPGRRVAVAAVDERNTVALAHQPEVDVVERKRQRHADPADAGRDLDRLAGGRRHGKRIEERFGHPARMGIGDHGWRGGARSWRYADGLSSLCYVGSR